MNIDQILAFLRNSLSPRLFSQVERELKPPIELTWEQNRLIQFLSSDSFSNNDIEDISFQIDYNREFLTNETKHSYAVDLVVHAYHEGKSNELITKMRKERPKLNI